MRKKKLIESMHLNVVCIPKLKNLIALAGWWRISLKPTRTLHRTAVREKSRKPIWGEGSSLSDSF